MLFEEQCRGSSSQTSTLVPVEEHPPCRGLRMNRLVQLQFPLNANVGRLVYDETPAAFAVRKALPASSHWSVGEAIPRVQAISRAADACTNAAAAPVVISHAVALQDVSSQRASASGASALPTSSSANAGSPRVLWAMQSLGTADLAGVHGSLMLVQLIEQALHQLQDVVDQSGFLIAPQCNATFRYGKTGFAGNAGAMRVWEWTAKNPETGQRNVTNTWLVGSSIATPLNYGGSYRYSLSDNSEMEGHNWSGNTMVRTKESNYGIGLGDSVVQGPTFNFWEQNRAGFNLGPELIRIDFMEPVLEMIPPLRVLARIPPVQALLAGLEQLPPVRTIERRFRPGLKCGGAFMIRSPALRYVPLYRQLGWLIEGLVRLKHRITENRAHYDHESDVPETLGNLFFYKTELAPPH